MADQHVKRVVTHGVTLEVAMTPGTGRSVLLVHGFPHDRHLWTPVIRLLPASCPTIAPDLRGIGGSTAAETGYDARSISHDLLGLLDGLGVEQADVVAIDAGVPPSFLLALDHPTRVRRLVLMESTLGRLPGAEAFTDTGGPWWFGFHQVPGLAETVLEGHEGEYLDFFYRAGTWDGAGLDPAVRDAFVSSYTGRESLRCGSEYYRAMPETDRQLRQATARNRLTTPTMVIGAQPVGPLLHRQLVAVAEDLRPELIADCGHIIPLDRPAELAHLLVDFLGPD